jgi:hypothetical protein
LLLPRKEERPMDAAFDYVSGVDLPGELHDWEEEVTLDDCPLCEDPCQPVMGLCRPCFTRVPRFGGCGLGLVVIITRSVDHLLTCWDCRDFVDAAGELGRVAAAERECGLMEAVSTGAT